MEHMTQRASGELAVVLDRSDPRPLPAQIADGIREQITRSALAPGDALPSTRTLARALGVSRGTAVAAYDQLLGEGYLQASQGTPTTVHPRLDRIHPGHTRTRGIGAAPFSRAVHGARIEGHGDGCPDPRHSVVDLRPGQPDATVLGGTAWRSAWRVAAQQPTAPKSDPLGTMQLRGSVAEHLRLMRALPAGPEHIVVTAGAREGLTLLLAATAARNDRNQLRVGLEVPGHPGLRQVPGGHGHTVVPCIVDHDGLRVDLLPTGRDAPDVLIVTPSHQYPLGGSLTLDRRLALLEWAQRWDVLVVEDDFDSELRYVGNPLPTLSDLDATGEQVALLGTFSTLLTPSLATGYVVVPHNLVAPVRELRLALGVPVASVTQFALAHLLESGYVRRHTQRMRSTYRRRRDAVQSAFEQSRHARLRPMHGGIDVVIHTDLDEDTVVRRCTEQALLVGRQSNYWTWDGSVTRTTASSAPLSPLPQGIVVGFAQAGDDVLTHLLPRLVQACGG